MSTRRNYNTPGHAHELTFSCYRGIPFLTEGEARRCLADAVNRACEAHRFRLWAYVFMPEHVHLLVWPEPQVYDIAAYRHRVKAWVARRVIKGLEQSSPALVETITRKRGQRIERLFWQPGAGYDRNIDRPETIRPVINYIHMNPVRRGLSFPPSDGRGQVVEDGALLPRPTEPEHDRIEPHEQDPQAPADLRRSVQA